MATGSHLDSVPDGGAFDGPLGVVSAFAAIDELRAAGFQPARPIVVAAFAEEEGGRFGVACLGSRLLTGAIDPDTARGLRDGAGITFADAMQSAGHDPARLGPDDDLLGQLATYVELHVEQGRALAGLDAAVGLAEGIWPHGRWRLDFTGRADHAGTAKLADRADPMLPYAHTVLAARQAAAALGTLATIGKVLAEPGAANAVSSAVHAWLDVRAAGPEPLAATVDQVLAAARAAAESHQVAFELEKRVGDAGGQLRCWAARAAGRGPGRPGDRGPGAAHRGRARRGHPGRPAAHRDAVRAQPDRSVPFACRACRGGRLCGRGDRAGRRAAGAGRVSEEIRRWHAELGLARRR